MSGVACALYLSARVRPSRFRRGHDYPAATSWAYTIVTIAREISYGKLEAEHFSNVPAFGVIIICGGYMALLLSCLLNDIWAEIPIFWERIAMRAAYLSVAQLSLLVVLSTKNNPIAFFLVSSHERVVIYHQLVGICTLLTTSLHMGYFMREWFHYDVWKSQWAEMGVSMLQWGFAAWGLLLLLVVTSLTGLRTRLHTAWFIFHILGMVSFFVMVILHLDSPYRVWAYVPLAIWIADRFLRLVKCLRINTSFTRLMKHSALVEPLPGGVSRITIPGLTIKHKVGQYIFLSITRFDLLSHPFTIASEPGGKDLVLLAKSKRGFTRSLGEHDLIKHVAGLRLLQCSVEGPYGGSHTQLQAFDSVLLIAGGIGSTFTNSLFGDIVRDPGCCRIVRYVWTIKEAVHAAWFWASMVESVEVARSKGVDMRVEIWITGTGDCKFEKIPGPSGDGHELRTSGETRQKLLCQEGILGQSRSGMLDGPANSCHKDNEVASPESPRSQQESTNHYLQLFSGRPDFAAALDSVASGALGEMGVFVCGPSSMTTQVRSTVVNSSDARGVKKGTGSDAIYLHIENQAA